MSLTSHLAIDNQVAKPETKSIYGLIPLKPSGGDNTVELPGGEPDDP